MNTFRSYIKLANNRYREQFGLDFEQFETGQKFRHRPGVTISQEDNAQEALDTINSAQLHYDANYASKTEWKNCLGVSTLTLQKVIGMTSKTFFRKKQIVEFCNIDMTHPVFGGDTLYAESEILGKEEYSEDPDLGLLHIVTIGRNQRGEEVTKIEYKALIYKQGKHPADEKGNIPRKGVEEEKFSSHSLLEDGYLIEEVGIYYEDLLPDEVYEHRPAKTFSTEENRLHALRSLEINPQYADEDFIQSFSAEGKMLITDMFIAGTVTALTTRTFGRVVANLAWKNIKLYAPVYAGDTVYVESKILTKRESKSRPTQGIMHVEAKAFNQNKKLVLSYERIFLIYKKGLGPYKEAGY